MFLFINSNNEIHGCDKTSNKEKYNDKHKIWYDGEFSFFDGENKDGYIKIFKWNGKEPIIEYEEIISVENEPSTEEKILANTDFLVMMNSF